MQPVVIKRERVALAERAAASSRRQDPMSHGVHPPLVRPIQHEGEIVALELTCSCGEVSLVELRYPSSPESQP